MRPAEIETSASMKSRTSAVPPAHNKPRNTERYEDFVRNSKIVYYARSRDMRAPLWTRIDALGISGLVAFSLRNMLVKLLIA